MSTKITSNIIDKKILRKVQIEALDLYANSLACTYGPMGQFTGYSYRASDAQGNGRIPATSYYTKDGLTVLRSILVDRPIEFLLKQELVDICKEVVKKVGDGTTSATILSSYLFRSLVKLEKQKFGRRQILQTFHNILKEGISIIEKRSRECTLDDIYNIAFTSLNGNEELASVIHSLYKECGLNVFIDVSQSGTEETIVKTYNGITYHKGILDSALANTCEDNILSFQATNVKVYVFESPIDTPAMMSIFKLIIETQITRKLSNKEKIDPVLILCPKISRDANSFLDQLINWYNKLDLGQRPPLCIVTDFLDQMEALLDISNLTGAPLIKKYIDKQNYQDDLKEGLVLTPENVGEFCGKTEKVVCDQLDVRIINPSKMYKENSTEYTEYFNNYISNIKAQYKKLESTGEDPIEAGRIRRRMNTLTANMVDLCVGGLGNSDRDSLIDSIEDAILNCRSSAEHGVSNGANYEGLIAFTILANNYTKKLENGSDDPDIVIKQAIATELMTAYLRLQHLLYDQYSEDPMVSDEIIKHSFDKNMPFNMITGEYDGKVLTSSKTEPVILDAIDRIITIIYNTNQYILPDSAFASLYDSYKNDDEEELEIVNETNSNKEPIKLENIIKKQ